MKNSSLQKHRAFTRNVWALILLLTFPMAKSYGQTPAKWNVTGNTIVTGDYIGTNNNEDFIIKTNGNTAVRVKANGNFILKSLESSGNGLVTFDNNGKLGMLNYTGDATKVLLADGTWGTLPSGSQWVNNGTKIYYNGGKVGIGTSTPNYKLDVDGDMRLTQNLYLQGALIISEKISTPKGVKAASVIADSILMDSTKAFYGDARFKGPVKLQNRLEVSGNTILDGDATVYGNFRTTGNLTFAGNKQILYSPATPGTPEIFSFGGPPVLPASPGGSGPCFFPSPTAPTYNQFNGMIQAHGISAIDGIQNVLSMGFDGANGIIDLAGGGADMGNPFPRLLINYYCGKDIYMCTGASGGKVVMAVGTSNGVGIGDEYIPAGYKLAVKGKIIAEELHVKLRGNWPDYVFEPTYKLKPIKELSDYIEFNKHLPDMPSAQTVENEGINASEMIAKLLKQQEELTLYIIEQNKRIEKLERLNK